MNTQTMPNTLINIDAGEHLDQFATGETTQQGILRTWFKSAGDPAVNVLLLNPTVAGFVLSHLTLILTTDFVKNSDKMPGRFVMYKPPGAGNIDNAIVMLDQECTMLTGDFVSIEYMVGQKLKNPPRLEAEQMDVPAEVCEVLQLSINVCEGNEECTTCAYHVVELTDFVEGSEIHDLYSEYELLIMTAQRLYGKL